MKPIPCLSCITRSMCVSRCLNYRPPSLQFVTQIEKIEHLTDNTLLNMARRNQCNILATYSGEEILNSYNRRKMNEIIYEQLIELFPNYNIAHIRQLGRNFYHFIYYIYFDIDNFLKEKKITPKELNLMK